MANKFRPRVPDKLRKSYKMWKESSKKENVLLIGDIHEPFCLDGYLEFNQYLYKKYNINRVIFAGDIIDNHYSSFHATDPDGMGGDAELRAAVEKLSHWYKAFPNAEVLYGNHDRIVSRKASANNVPSAWIKDIHEVLQVPNWIFTPRIESNGVEYVHGDGGGQARARAKNEMCSVAQGHFHTVAYTEWYHGIGKPIFAMQAGCGVDRDAYALAYARGWKKQVIASGLILEDATIAFNAFFDHWDGKA